MTYIDKYSKILSGLEEDIRRYKESDKKTVFGYTSDLDVVVNWDADKFNSLLNRFLKEEPSFIDGEMIDNMEDFARIVSYYMINGMGGEADITNVDVCNYLEEHFETNFALGGTCAQGAAALASVGVPLVVHITDRSNEVCNIFNHPNIQLVTSDGIVSVLDGKTDELPIRHMILQFNKGEVINVLDKRIAIPVSNRLILDYDKIHKYLPIDLEFLNYCEENAKNIFSYNISGFNAIIDLEIMKTKVNEMSMHYRRIKEINPNCIIYLEGAHYLNSLAKDFLFEKISAYVDILGMNEEELIDFCNKFRIEVDKENLESMLNGLRCILKKYPVKGLVMHTKDYSMYFGKEIPGIDIEKGLTMGNLMSATRARTGRYGTQQDCRDSLMLSLSEIGLKFYDELGKMKIGEYAKLVPSRYMEKPKYTIGLGDTFVAGMQIGFIK